MRARRIPLHPQEGAGQPLRPVHPRPVAQELVEILAVDHADIAALDMDIDRPPRG